MNRIKIKKILMIFGVSLLALFVRYLFRNQTCGDYDRSYKMWFEKIVAHGGFIGFKEKVSNYSVIVELMITLLTYIPLSSLYLYKILVVCFDYIMAVGCGKITKLYLKSDYGFIFGYAIVLLCPTVFLNSGAWGQFDSMYVSFIVWSFYFLLKDNYPLMMVMFGLSLIIKLQAIFFLPFLLLVYLIMKKYSLIFYLIPVTVFALSDLIGVILGRPFGAEVAGNVGNVGMFSEIFMNYPSFYALIQQEGRIISAISIMAPYLFLIAMILVARLFLLQKNLSSEMLLYMAMITTYTAVFFLPTMHERYGYMYEILGLLYATVNKKAIPFVIVMIGISTVTYSFYFGWCSKNMFVLALYNLICYCGLLIIGIKKYGLLTKNISLELD